MYRAFRIINNQYGGCVVYIGYIHDVSIHNASELTFAKTGNCPNVSHISHCVILCLCWDSSRHERIHPVVKELNTAVEEFTELIAMVLKQC